MDIAINADKPQSFELMLDMLEDFKHNCLSKMMLSTFPHLVMSHSDIVYKFFQTASYEPHSMSSNFKIPWPNDMQEVIFTSHTILISEHKLLMEIGRSLKGLSYTGIRTFFKETSQWLNKGDLLNRSKKNKKDKKTKKDDNYKKIEDEDSEDNEQQDVDVAYGSIQNWKEKVKRKQQIMRAQILDEEVTEKK